MTTEDLTAARELLSRAQQLYLKASEYRQRAFRLEEQAKRMMRRGFYYQEAEEC